MYETNEFVLYGAHGVCEVAEITEKELNGSAVEYYVLKPVYDPNSTIFVPLHNAKLTDKMRYVLSAEEIYELIQEMPDENTIWIEEESKRREQYKKILEVGDRKGLVCLIKTLYLRQQKLKEGGKKLHMAEDRFMKDAEKMLFEEFAHVLTIERDQVLPFIMDQMEEKVQAK